MFAAVQHERAPKIPNSAASLTTSGIHYPAHFYTASRWTHDGGLIPFQLASPITFPFDNYHLTVPYYPHLAESLNLKINQTIYRPTLNSTTTTSPSNYDQEIGKMFTNNLLSRVPNTNVICKEEKTEGGNKNGVEFFLQT